MKTERVSPPPSPNPEQITITLSAVELMTDKAKNAYVVCDDCGNFFGARPKTGKNILSTYYEGECNICGAKDLVTEFRDFGYVKKV
jgi:hypothetical protein